MFIHFLNFLLFSLIQPARTIFRVLHENSTLGGIIKCCGVWLARDCWIRHAEELCIEAHVIDMYKLPFKLLPKLDQWCAVYHDQTFVCLLPHYLPLTFLVISIATTIAVLWYVGWKLKARKGRLNRKSSSIIISSRRQSSVKELSSTSAAASVTTGEQFGSNVETTETNESSANDNLLDQNQNISSDSHWQSATPVHSGFLLKTKLQILRSAKRLQKMARLLRRGQRTRLFLNNSGSALHQHLCYTQKSAHN